MSLFAHSEQASTDWRTANANKRREEFSPLKVRLKLENVGTPIPMDEDAYREFCEAFAHLNPRTKPQAHNPFGIPVAGASFQEAGALVTLNELASIMISIAGAGALLLRPPGKRNAFISAIEELDKAIGSIDLKHTRDHDGELHQSPGFQELQSLLRARQLALRNTLADEVE